MKVFLKELELKNFKGIDHLNIKFKENTIILGANATGKTTVFDAFIWLLFGKDSTNKKDFSIKGIEADGEVPSCDHIVAGVIEVDGQEVLLKKTFKEKWTTKRGSQEKVYSGNTTEYEINGIPKKEKDYQEFINNIADENIFKLLTNPKHFNEVLSKDERREILLKLCEGEIKEEDIIKENPDLKALDLKNYSLDDLEAMNKATAKKLKKEIEELPARLDELKNSKKEFDFDVLNFRRGAITGGIKQLQEQKIIDDNSKDKQEAYAKIAELQKKKIALKEDDFNKNKKIKELNSKAQKDRADEVLNFDINCNKLKAADAQNSALLKNVSLRIDKLRIEYSEVASNKEMNCPTCNQPLPEDLFKKTKSEKLEEIIKNGNELKEELQKLQAESESIQNKLLGAKGEKEKLLTSEIELIPEIKENPEIEELEREIRKLEKKLENNKAVDFGDIDKKLNDLNKELEEIDGQIAYEKINKEIDEKIKTYKGKEKEIAKSLEETEKTLYLISLYSKARSKLIADEVNKKFKNVNFKLFDTQVNGAVVETCETTVNGVPYPDVNNAGKINAGLEIIKILSEQYDFQAPIFIDNAEAVNNVIEMPGQTIKLVVSEDKKLVIK
ncbi:MAG: AAA family ATPase [Peptoniphilus sp.]|uniref:AAA family ATPase n=1 Tax=Peptoniphilus sp. TaxID=1971214 RepID=UPI003991CD5C